MKSLIFTDLDGTFLNHHNYSFEESFEALQRVKVHEIPLIFTTSKTKAEVELLQQKVGISEPFIVENGAALFIPSDYHNFDLSLLESYEDKKIMAFGKPYKKVLEFYNLYKDEFGMVGFSDMPDSQITELTGLSTAEVFLARQREFTEPFILKDVSKFEELEKLTLCYELKVTKGGRFYHLMGEMQDKGIAVMETVALFEKLYGSKIKSIALGDSQNDLAMLERVMVPIAIQNHKGEYVGMDLKNIQTSTHQGSKGWNEMILKNV
ncbi:HAD-IIB family hydrolase [bacterium]|nr:HAD-IIB family hydrolase [bacterium]MBU1959173.1 HAD-IIB family hydrolase [bacterium]